MYWSWNNTTIKFYCKTQEHILVMKIKQKMAFEYVKFAYRRGTCTSFIAVTLKTLTYRQYYTAWYSKKTV